MRSRLVRLLPVLALAALASACQTSEAPKQGPNDPAQVRLATAAETASNALRTLAEIENRKNPAPVKPTYDLAALPDKLSQPMNMKWIGPVGPLVKALADAAGYGFTETGQRPTNAIIVTVDAKDEPLVDILRDVGLQAGTRASVDTDVNHRNIELRYVLR